MWVSHLVYRWNALFAAQIIKGQVSEPLCFFLPCRSLIVHFVTLLSEEQEIQTCTRRGNLCFEDEGSRRVAVWSHPTYALPQAKKVSEVACLPPGPMGRGPTLFFTFPCNFLQGISYVFAPRMREFGGSCELLHRHHKRNTPSVIQVGHLWDIKILRRAMEWDTW